MTTPKLTEPMRTMLTAASHPQGLRRTPTTPWPHHPNTERALLNRGLIDQTVILNGEGQPIETWTITSEGRQALNPPPRHIRDTVRTLHGARTTTRILQGETWEDRIIPEPERVDPFTQARITAEANTRTDQWRELEQARHEARALDARLREALIIADHKGVDVSRQVASIRQRIVALERRLQRDLPSGIAA